MTNAHTPTSMTTTPPITSTPIQQQQQQQQQQHQQHVSNPNPNAPPFPTVFSFPSASAPTPLSLPPTPFVPHLTFMEGQFAAQAVFVELQRRIKTLEAELASTQIELMRVRASVQPSRPAVPNQQSSSQNNLNDNQPSSQNQQQQSQSNQQDDAKKASSRYWTADEHNRFLEGLRLFGQKDIKSISRHVGTRSATQVRTHAQKYYLRIERERQKAEQEGRVSDPTSDNRLGKASRNANPTSSPTNIQNKRSNSKHHQRPPDANSKSHSSTRNHSHSTSANGNSSSSNHQVDFTNLPSSDATQSARLENTTTPKSEPHAIMNPMNPNQVNTEQTITQPKVDISDPTNFSSSAFLENPRNISIGIAHTRSHPSDDLGEMSDMLTNNSPQKDPQRASSPNGYSHDPTPSNTMPDQIPSPSNSLNKKGRKPVKAEDEEVKDDDGITKANDDNKKTTGKRAGPQTPKRGPRKRAKKPTPTVPAATDESAEPSSQPNSQPLSTKPPVPTNPGSINKQPPENKWYTGEQVGSMSNLRALVRISNDDPLSVAGSSKPPTLRRTESSNSVLADLSKNVGVLSRSDSFIFSKGVTRNNSILSLLSGIPTAMRESPSTDRLFGLDSTDDKLLPTLKSTEGGSSSMNPLGAGSSSLGNMGDRSLSFSQLQHMGLDELEDPNNVALTLQDDQKWGDG